MLKAIGIWALKTLITFAFSAMAIWYGSFWIADYVSEKHVRGLTVAVDQLSTKLTDLNATVTLINTHLSEQLIALERERASLAVEIAKEVGKVRGEQGVQRRDIEHLQNSVDRIEKSVMAISENTKVHYTVDGGKTFESIAPAEALVKFGLPRDNGAYVIAPWSYNKFDPEKGAIEPLNE